MSGALIEVQWRCLKCRIDWQNVNVRERREGEEVTDWIKVPQVAVYEDRDRRFRKCRHLVDVRIPMTDGKHIGNVQPQ